MSSTYAKDYLQMIQKHIDPEATIDSDGNVVYVDQHIIVVPPEDCERIMNEIMGVPEYE